MQALATSIYGSYPANAAMMDGESRFQVRSHVLLTRLASVVALNTDPGVRTVSNGMNVPTGCRSRTTYRLSRRMLSKHRGQATEIETPIGDVPYPPSGPPFQNALGTSAEGGSPQFTAPDLAIWLYRT